MCAGQLDNICCTELGYYWSYIVSSSIKFDTAYKTHFFW